MTRISNISMSRRKFLGGSAASAGVFLLGLHVPLGRFASAADDEGVINAFIGIAEDVHGGVERGIDNVTESLY